MDNKTRHDLRAESWDLREFRENPVVLSRHRPSMDPIGKISVIWTSDDTVYGVGSFSRQEQSDG